jgi:hypothetical protein
MKINGIEYIALSKYKQLEKSKIKTKEVIKEVAKEIIKPQEIQFVLDSCTILGMFKVPEEYRNGDEIIIGSLKYKKIVNPKILHRGEKFNSKKIEACLVENTIYSKEMIDKIYLIAKQLYYDNGDEEIYMVKDGDCFIKDNPLLIKFGNNLCFILAPRIESVD